MIGFPSGVRVHFAIEPHDLCKSFNGLAAIASALVERGLLFVFTNKRRNRLKILYYDRIGVCLLAKRLEKGIFSWPLASKTGASAISLAPNTFALLLDGNDLRGAEMRPWYGRDKNFIDRSIADLVVGASPAVSARIEAPEQTIARKDREIEAANANITLLEAKLDHLVRRLFVSAQQTPSSRDAIDLVALLVMLFSRAQSAAV